MCFIKHSAHIFCMTTTKITEVMFFFRFFFDVIVLRVSDMLLTSSGIVGLDCVDSKRRFSSENIGTQGFFFVPKIFGGGGNL